MSIVFDERHNGNHAWIVRTSSNTYRLFRETAESLPDLHGYLFFTLWAATDNALRFLGLEVPFQN